MWTVRSQRQRSPLALVTTDKLAAQAVTAAKINVKDLFAQDITATGTIRGVTLQGAKGEIGGFQINSTRLYSVDSSGTYAAYFGSYDFNKTNAFVAQTKVNGRLGKYFGNEI